MVIKLKESYMKRIIVIAFLVLVAAFDNAKAQEIGITREIYIKLCGVWDLNKGVGEDDMFSWGKGKTVVNGSTEIDLGADPPSFFSGGAGKFNILKIYKEKDKFIIKIMTRSQGPCTFEVAFIDDETIIFKEKDIKVLDYPGEKFKHYKISGPTIRYIKPKIENLRLRSQPSADGKILRMLKKDEKLLIIMKGKEETIDKVKGNWIKVLTEKEEMGWCFDGYLESVK
jgi:hypothetical protein